MVLEKRVDDERTQASGLIARGGGEGSARLLEHAILELFEERETASPAAIRAALEDEYGYRGAAATVSTTLIRLVEQSVLVRVEEGVYIVNADNA